MIEMNLTEPLAHRFDETRFVDIGKDCVTRLASLNLCLNSIEQILDMIPESLLKEVS